MIFAKELRSGTGPLLLGKCIKLTDRNIQSINRHFQIDPPKGNIFVLVKR